MARSVLGAGEAPNPPPTGDKVRIGDIPVKPHLHWPWSDTLRHIPLLPFPSNPLTWGHPLLDLDVQTRKEALTEAAEWVWKAQEAIDNGPSPDRLLDSLDMELTDLARKLEHLAEQEPSR